MTNLDSIVKGRDITLPTEVHLVKAMVYPVVIYGKTIALTRRTFVGKVMSLLLNLQLLFLQIMLSAFSLLRILQCVY